MFGHDISQYQKRFDAFGWNTIVVDGQNIEEVVEAFRKARENRLKPAKDGKLHPTVVLAKTFKGAHFGEEICDKNGWHGTPLKDKS